MWLDINTLWWLWYSSVGSHTPKSYIPDLERGVNFLRSRQTTWWVARRLIPQGEPNMAVWNSSGEPNIAVWEVDYRNFEPGSYAVRHSNTSSQQWLTELLSRPFIIGKTRVISDIFSGSVTLERIAKGCQKEFSEGCWWWWMTRCDKGIVCWYREIVIEFFNEGLR